MTYYLRKVPPDLLERVRRAAAAEGRGVRAVILDMLEIYVADRQAVADFYGPDLVSANSLERIRRPEIAGNEARGLAQNDERDGARPVAPLFERWICEACDHENVHEPETDWPCGGCGQPRVQLATVDHDIDRFHDEGGPVPPEAD